MLKVTNTDDFIWRLVKGCIQLGLVPDIINAVNMVPVDHVAALIASASRAPFLQPSAGTSISGTGDNSIVILKGEGMPVLHVTARPLPTYNRLFGAVRAYGYAVRRCDYVRWRAALSARASASSSSAPVRAGVGNNAKENTQARSVPAPDGSDRPTAGDLSDAPDALYPLLHFVLDDLPAATRAPRLFDDNAQVVLRSAAENDGATVGRTQVGIYLAWLVAAGFLPAPPPPVESAGGVLVVGVESERRADGAGKDDNAGANLEEEWDWLGDEEGTLERAGNPLPLPRLIGGARAVGRSGA